MKTYTIEEQDAIGKKIAMMLCLRKDSQYKDRFQTTWGNKTAIGIFNTIIRLADNINNGKSIVA